MIKINVEKKDTSAIDNIISVIRDNGGKILETNDKNHLCFELKGIPLNRKSEILKELKKY